jgi:hypothetical protein
MATKATSRRVKVNPNQTQSQTRTYLIIGAVAVGVIGLAILLYLALRPTPPIRGVVLFPRLERGHDETLEIAFGELPPAGGVHNPVWQNCGIYTEPIFAQNVIHSLEHGAVWVTYQPDLPADDLTRLQDMMRGETYIIMSPYPNQRSPIVLTAWGVQLEVESSRDRRIGQFVQRYRMGPQTPERGGACVQGIGTPDG